MILSASKQLQIAMQQINRIRIWYEKQPQTPIQDVMTFSVNDAGIVSLVVKAYSSEPQKPNQTGEAAAAPAAELSG